MLFASIRKIYQDAVGIAITTIINVTATVVAATAAAAAVAAVTALM